LPFAQWVHAQEYIDRVAQISQNGGGRLDPDTGLSSDSYEVALLGINAWIDGAEQVLNSGQPAFVLSRPPGHHALTNRGMGFCIFSNAAIAAHYALKRLSVKRVAILDWDVHHGNGTQALVESSPEIAYCSLHESPHYPGTGDPNERGEYQNVLNIPMPAGSGIAEYRVAFRDRAIPFIKNWQPDLLIVSAGYDAHYVVSPRLRRTDRFCFRSYPLHPVWLGRRIRFDRSKRFGDRHHRAVFGSIQPAIEQPFLNRSHLVVPGCRVHSKYTSSIPRR
jgi:acetoin utilization deacetylase AcuC-like enzyme